MKNIVIIAAIVFHSIGVSAQYCRHYGGSNWDELFSITVDPNNGRYVSAGLTYSHDLDVVPVLYPWNSGSDAWILVLDSTGTILNSK